MSRRWLAASTENERKQDTSRVHAGIMDQMVL